ncbi:MAG: tRNA pseudouridine(55) synthase TruB [Chlorobi bacterium]|nr:tRNA pseudouridine(55) synthase TruB [Chlorobiota bacterium]
MIPLLSHSTSTVESWLPLLPLHGGAVLVDKPTGWTSFDVVAKLRRILRIKKIGHTGTLDPIATGLLIVCVGKATKHVGSFQDLDKEYRVEVKLGARTPSDDCETAEYDQRPIDHLTDSMIVDALKTFIGSLEQIPPSYSAIHAGGRRMYELARRGKTLPPIAPRRVNIHTITEIEYCQPYLRFTVRCSKGTYIRALARDLGEQLGVGGYVTALRRTAIGNYRVEDAFDVLELIRLLTQTDNANVSLDR